MVHFKNPENFTVDEVSKWLTAIGLESKIENFEESGVDGSMLVILSEEDFGELGLSGLQGKKLLTSLAFSKSIAEGNPKGEADNEADGELVQQLRDENEALRAQLAEYQQRDAAAPPAVEEIAESAPEALPLPVRVPVPVPVQEPEPEPQGPSTFAMREKMLLSIGDNQRINKMTDGRRGRGEPAYFANNRVLRLRETFELQNLDHQTLYKIQERKMRARDAMAIHDANGERVAEIKKKFIGVVRDNYVVKIRGEKNWKIHGSILEHNFTILEDDEEIVTVHKRWIAPIRDCYMIDIKDGVDEGLALCVCVALESMSED